MMTFKRVVQNNLEDRRGSSTVFLALGLAVVTSAAVWYGTIQLQKMGRVAKKNRSDSQQLMVAHAMAALLKQEFLQNFQRIQSNNPSCVNAISLASSIESFLQAMDSPPAACVNEVFIFSNFTKVPSGASVPLTAVKTTKFVPTAENMSSGVFDVQLQLTHINLATQRVTGNIDFIPKAKSKEILGGRTLKFVVDVSRTLASLTLQPSCHICRTQPGGVCCPTNSAQRTNLFYLEAAGGRVMEVDYDPVPGTTVYAPVSGEPTYPQAVSIKNVGEPTTVYIQTSFKIPAINPTKPIEYVVDTATDNTGKVYYLTASGSILDANGGEIVKNPVFTSFCYTNGKWYVLRSDGNVLSTSTLVNLSTYEPTGLVLKTAERLASGVGTTDIFK